MVRSPLCGFEGSVDAFRRLRESWRFRFYTVRMLECPSCNGVFNHYEGVSTTGKHSAFFIRVRPRTKVSG